MLHVVGQSGGQRARVQLVELDQLQQIVKLGRPFVQGVQPAIATLVEDLKGNPIDVKILIRDEGAGEGGMEGSNDKNI